MIHAANAIFLDDHINTTEKWVLLLDFKNAFNSVSHEKMLAAIRQHCPKAAAWADTCYAAPSHLFFSTTRISSSSGAQQGDPLSSTSNRNFPASSSTPLSSMTSPFPEVGPSFSKPTITSWL